MFRDDEKTLYNKKRNSTVMTLMNKVDDDVDRKDSASPNNNEADTFKFDENAQQIVAKVPPIKLTAVNHSPDQRSSSSKPPPPIIESDAVSDMDEYIPDSIKAMNKQ